MNWVFESPLTILMLGALCVVGLGVAWLKFGRGQLLVGAVAALAITAVLLLVEQMTITDREQIRRLIEQAVSDVESNDASAVLSHIHSRAQTLRDGAQSGMRQYRFKQVIARSPDIAVDRSKSPATARIEFHVNVTAIQLSYGQAQFPGFVEADLELENGHWRLVHARLYHAVDGAKKPELRKPLYDY